MKFNFDDKLLELAKECGQGQLSLFFLISLPATFVAISVIGYGEQECDMTDGGVVSIVVLTALICYGAIALYIRRLFTR